MAMILGCLLAGLFLSLPVCAVRSDAVKSNPASDSEPLSQSPPVTSVTGGQAEQDPIHAAESPPHSGGWPVAALCVLVAVSVLLLIFAMIPNKRK